MRFRFRFALLSLLLAGWIGICAGPAAIGQSGASAGRHGSSASGSQTEAVRPGAEVENNEFRHAPMVRLIARALHVETEAAAQIFEDVNSGILILAILFFVLKFLPKALRNRTATLQKQLIEARSATEIANERLSAVEAKLARLGEDIEAVRQQTERDVLEDEKRIKRSLEEEKDKIVKSAEQEIESAGAAAQRELRRFAAELSIDRAAAQVRLSDEADRALVGHFGKDLISQLGKGGRN